MRTGAFGNTVSLIDIAARREVSRSETALGVSDLDIRKMLRLTAAQEKRLAQAAEAAPLTQAAE
jgi:hypothetical protein